MEYKEIKDHYMSGQLHRHRLLDESGCKYGEYRRYHENGQLFWHYFSSRNSSYGEVKVFNDEGALRYHFLKCSKGNVLASTTNDGKPDKHSEEQLIQIAKEHNLPLLSEMPNTEAERTLWNLKWPDLPLLPIESE